MGLREVIRLAESSMRLQEQVEQTVEIPIPQTQAGG